MLENMALRLCCEHRLLRPRAEPTAGYTHSGQAPQEHPAARHVLLTHTEPASDTQAPGRAEASCSPCRRTRVPRPRGPKALRPGKECRQQPPTIQRGLLLRVLVLLSQHDLLCKQDTASGRSPSVPTPARAHPPETQQNGGEALPAWPSHFQKPLWPRLSSSHLVRALGVSHRQSAVKRAWLAPPSRGPPAISPHPSRARSWRALEWGQGTNRAQARSATQPCPHRP